MSAQPTHRATAPARLRQDDVLKVRSSAVFRHRGGWAVYAIRDGRATLVPVEVGRSNGLATQILSGIEAGARMVSHPSDQVVPGARVEVR